MAVYVAIQTFFITTIIMISYFSLRGLYLFIGKDFFLFLNFVCFYLSFSSFLPIFIPNKFFVRCRLLVCCG